MAKTDQKRNMIGLIIGRESDWPEAFMAAVESRGDGARAEIIKLGGTYPQDTCPYPVIIDRMSHEIPYYRTYVKYAAMNGSYVINNPFVWSADNRFFGTAVAERLGFNSPRTIVLPNKDTLAETVPDSFRNLIYPMDWEGIIAHIGVPAIFKEIQSGGRRLSFRVNNVEELIQRYDESGTRTMMLQQVIEGGEHIHCLVVGMEHTLLLHYDPDEKRYLSSMPLGDAMAEELSKQAIAITKAYGYDINLIEFNHRDGRLTVINSTNPSPIIDHHLLVEQQFEWAVNKTADLALQRLASPAPQAIPFRLRTAS
ncbi:MAG: RimK family alpha-L-glutamate ligase [Candidatus Promineifilaceae bacterium]